MYRYGVMQVVWWFHVDYDIIVLWWWCNGVVVWWCGGSVLC